ncbi:MAG: hypothetical protein K2X11_00720 [Acetobacteraceae bacterium]|nr:hypothetical protein [Acetobacteraceae bacterium]
MTDPRDPRRPSPEDENLQRPDTGTAGEPEPKGRANPERYETYEVLEEGLPDEYRKEDPTS